jgi:hypothetical protein
VTTYDILDRVTSVTIPTTPRPRRPTTSAPTAAGQTRFRTTVIDANGAKGLMALARRPISRPTPLVFRL